MLSPTWIARPDDHVPDEVARLLATVPEWFGQPASNAEYIEAACTKETWTVRDAVGAVVGVTLVDRHFPTVAEVHLIVVDRAAHGAGIGTAMLSALEADARARGVRLLEETELWGEGTPCLIMVKPLPTGRIPEDPREPSDQETQLAMAMPSRAADARP